MKHTFRSMAKALLYPRPRALGAFGRGSIIKRPRKLEGRRHIFIGARCLILERSWIAAVDSRAAESHDPRITIGDDVYIGTSASIQATRSITIGSGCVLSERVFITDLSHGFDPRQGLIMAQPLVSKGPVEIGSHCFLGVGCCVLPGVQLGERCIVGANSVVTHSFPPYTMIAGSPARAIGHYDWSAQRWSVNAAVGVSQ